MTSLFPSEDVLHWLEVRRAKTTLAVKAVPLDGCGHWRWDGVSLRHEGGHFFSVIGMRTALANVPESIAAQPMIDQPEIGVLGFLVRRAGDRVEWLLQAKAEPGNVLGVQVGPSVQATLSNYQRAHRGRPTPLIECFVGNRSVSVKGLEGSGV